MDAVSVNTAAALRTAAQHVLRGDQGDCHPSTCTHAAPQARTGHFGQTPTQLSPSDVQAGFQCHGGETVVTGLSTTCQPAQLCRNLGLAAYGFPQKKYSDHAVSPQLFSTVSNSNFNFSILFSKINKGDKVYPFVRKETPRELLQTKVQTPATPPSPPQNGNLPQ